MIATPSDHRIEGPVPEVPFDPAVFPYRALLGRRLVLSSAVERLPLGSLRSELAQLRRINTKTAANSFVKSAGFRTVDSTEYPSIEAAMKAAATPRFVIKP